MEPSGRPERFEEPITGYLPDPQGRDYTIRHSQTSASGLAAVWARENTREALWDAMKRKEVYATTGTRLLVRVFAGWDFEPEEVDRWDFAATGYSRGVPMGGDLRDAPAGQAPVLMVRALRDPDAANLDRIQVIKGWLNADGSTGEQVYNVAWSDEREIGRVGTARIGGQHGERRRRELHRGNIGAGGSRWVIRSNTSLLRIGAGTVVNVERFDAETAPAGKDAISTSVEGIVQVEWAVFRFDSPELDLLATANVFPSVSDAGRVRTDVDLRVRYEVLSDFFLGLTVFATADSRPPSEDATRRDFGSAITLGWWS